MKKKYTKKQIRESISDWKKQLSKMNESHDPLTISFSSKQPLKVKTLKDKLSRFSDDDTIDICLPTGEYGNTVVQMWNSDAEYDRELPGDEIDWREGVCHMRVMPYKIDKVETLNEASWEEANDYHNAYLKLGEYLAPYILNAHKNHYAGQDVSSTGGEEMACIEAMFAMAEYVLSKPNAADWQKEVARKVAQLGAGYMI